MYYFSNGFDVINLFSYKAISSTNTVLGFVTCYLTFGRIYTNPSLNEEFYATN